jgi:integrase
MTTLSLHIDTYLNAMKGRWAPTTLRSETARLKNVGPYLDGRPETLWAGISTLSPYARCTTWVRVVQYVDFLISENLIHGKNNYKIWRMKNNHLFRHAYVRSTPTMSYTEAVSKVKLIGDTQLRAAALSLLSSGLRVGELAHVENGAVKGKGGKTRQVFNAQRLDVPYHQLYLALKKVGLKPHDLRKLFASRLVEEGANEFELTAIMGWSSIVTAQSYVRTDVRKLEQLVLSASEQSEETT